MARTGMTTLAGMRAHSIIVGTYAGAYIITAYAPIGTYATRKP